MPTTNITFRMDELLKKQAESLFDQMGINMTTALNAFVKETVREGKMPFDLKGDDRAFGDNISYEELARVDMHRIIHGKRNLVL